jgi:hypothetical protein
LVLQGWFLLEWCSPFVPVMAKQRRCAVPAKVRLAKRKRLTGSAQLKVLATGRLLLEAMLVSMEK